MLVDGRWREVDFDDTLVQDGMRDETTEELFELIKDPKGRSRRHCDCQL